jgi:hypothetical protein
MEFPTRVRKSDGVDFIENRYGKEDGSHYVLLG